MSGYLKTSLERNPKAVRDARSQELYENLEIEYKRKVEDLQLEIKRMNNKIKSLFDFAPENSFSLVVKNVDSQDIIEQHLGLLEGIRVKTIDLENAKKAYDFLFNDDNTTE
jgi:phosphoglycerate-specific signal transduction histidine kinase